MPPRVFLISVDKAVSLMKPVFRIVSSEAYGNGLAGVGPQVLHQTHSRLSHLRVGLNAGRMEIPGSSQPTQ